MSCKNQTQLPNNTCHALGTSSVMVTDDVYDKLNNGFGLTPAPQSAEEAFSKQYGEAEISSPIMDVEGNPLEKVCVRGKGYYTWRKFQQRYMNDQVNDPMLSEDIIDIYDAENNRYPFRGMAVKHPIVSLKTGKPMNSVWVKHVGVYKWDAQNEQYSTGDNLPPLTIGDYYRVDHEHKSSK